MTSAERSARITELQTQIANIDTKITQMLASGQSYMIMTSAGGGSQRSTTMVNFSDLTKYRDKLNAELKSLQGDKAFRMSPAW